MSLSAVKRFLVSNGVAEFWAASAMEWIGRVAAGNRHFIQEISNPKLRTHRGMVDRFECDASVCIPDSGEAAKARVLYTFDPDARIAHKVEIALRKAGQ